MENVKFVTTQTEKRTNQHTVYTVSDKNIGKNVKKYIKPLTHDNVIRVEWIKRRFITVTTEVCSKVLQEKRIKLIGYTATNSSGMMLLMISTFDDKIAKEFCVDEYVEAFRKCHHPIKLGNSSEYHFRTSGEVYGIGLVAKYNIDKDGYSYGPYAERCNQPRKPHFTDVHNIIEKLLELSLKSPEKIIPNIYKNTTIIGSIMKDHIVSKKDFENDKANFYRIPSYISS